MKKLYLVKREVIASSIKEALTAKGIVYEINTVDAPLVSKANPGFIKKKKK